MTNAQEWLNKRYPTPESKEKETELEMEVYGDNSRQIEGELDLRGFVNLQNLTISGAKITRLNLGNKQLFRLYVDECPQLTTIQGLENCPNLTDITIVCPPLQPLAFLDSWKEEITQLKAQLTTAQQKYQNHLTQEKAQLTKEIQLIKEVIQ